MPDATQPGGTPATIPHADATAILGVLSVINGTLMTEGMSEYLIKKVRNSLAREGLVAPNANEHALGHAITELIQRLRHASENAA